MAAAAGFALLHLTHGETLVSGAWNKQFRMAILAAIGGNMYRMAEYGAAGAKIDLFDCVAFLAVGFHTKGALAIVAGTARAPLFHVGHAGPYTLFTSLKNTIVTLDTGEHTLVNRMTEGCCSGFLDLENNIDGRFVTRIAISFYTEHGRTIVTASAGRTFFHLSHGHPFVIRTGVVELVVAIRAGVQDKMFVMIKSGVVRKKDFLDRMAFIT